MTAIDVEKSCWRSFSDKAEKAGILLKAQSLEIFEQSGAYQPF